MNKRAFVSILVLVALMGLSSIAFGQEESGECEDCDQAVEEEVDQVNEEEVDQAVEAVYTDENFRSGGDVYKTVVLAGTSTTGWEDAVKTALDRATKSLRDVHVAEVKKLDVHLEYGKIQEYRAWVELSFKYEG